MRLFFIFICLTFFSLKAQSQDKTVTLTTSGIGRTQDEAKQNALRNAIEQAFGTFISSKTEILNDELVNDEVISVSSGNVVSFEVLNNIKLPDESYSATVSAVISVTKLTSFVEGKGVTVEFKGTLFAFNATQQALNKKNEITAVKEMCTVVRKIAENAFDFSIQASEPTSLKGNEEIWKIPLEISASINENFQNIPNYMSSTLKGLSLSFTEAEDYMTQKKFVYPISFSDQNDATFYFILRSEESVQEIMKTLYYFNHALLNFDIVNGIDTFQIQNKPDGLEYIYDFEFRIFLKKFKNARYYNFYIPGSVFYILSSPYEIDPFTKKSCNLGRDKVYTGAPKQNCNKVSIVAYNSYFNLCDFCLDKNVIVDYAKWSSLKRAKPSSEKDSFKMDYNLTGYNIVSVYSRIPEGLSSSDKSGSLIKNKSISVAKESLRSRLPLNVPVNTNSSNNINQDNNESSEYVNTLVSSLDIRFEFIKKLKTLQTIGFYQTVNHLPSFSYDNGSGSFALDNPKTKNEYQNINVKETGLVISFRGIKSSTELVRYYYTDVRRLSEIQRISGYSIKPRGTTN